jgi:dihydroflavonol-4-reductase
VRILVTGASGFIGAHTAAALADAGGEVRAFCRSEPPATAGVADWVAGDVVDAGAVERAASDCQAIVHVAALYSYARADASSMHAVNVEGTRHVVNAAARAGIRRVVVTSSSATCGPVVGRAADERDQPPDWELKVPYKRTKLEAERVALTAAGPELDVMCVNPTTVVGPGDRQPTPSGKMVHDLVAGKINAYLRGAGINVVAVQDVARGHVLALERGRSGARYILGGEDLRLRDAFGLVMAEVGRPPPRFAVPWTVVYGAAVVADGAARAIGREPRLLVLDEVRLARLPLFFSSDRAKAELGYAPRSAADALREAARWFAGQARS